VRERERETGAESETERNPERTRSEAGLLVELENPSNPRDPDPILHGSSQVTVPVAISGGLKAICGGLEAISGGFSVLNENLV
jgi:hypothetical protein